jgi:hypothetical protein
VASPTSAAEIRPAPTTEMAMMRTWKNRTMGASVSL